MVGTLFAPEPVEKSALLHLVDEAAVDEVLRLDALRLRIRLSDLLEDGLEPFTLDIEPLLEGLDLRAVRGLQDLPILETQFLGENSEGQLPIRVNELYGFGHRPHELCDDLGPARHHRSTGDEGRCEIRDAKVRSVDEKVKPLRDGANIHRGRHRGGIDGATDQGGEHLWLA